MFALLLVLIGTIGFNAAAPATTERLEIVSASVRPSSRSISLDQHADQVVSFWTQSKLDAATPVMPRLTIKSQSGARTAIINSDPPVFIDGTIGSLQKAAMTTASPDKVSGRQVFAYTGRQTYTTGRVLWNNTDNTYGMCSGAIVTAGNKDTIVTAGHCCYDYDKRQWRINQNFVFVPAYNKGRPYGTWAARTMTAYTSWTVDQNYNYDVCFVNLHTNSNGQHIQDLLGSEGLGYNYPRNAIMYSFGYPKNLAQGEVMQYCSGTAASSKYGNGYLGQTIPCDMTGGCSGGPWLQNFIVSSGTGYVTSLNSFTLNNIANYMNGPYFDSSIWSLYQQCAVK